MAKWYKKYKYRIEYKNFIFEYGTAWELGTIVAESGCNMSNPYDLLQ